MKNDTFSYRSRLELQNVVQYVSAAFSLFFNVLLILLIALKSPKQLGAYKYLMMCISIHEILYSLLDFIVSPIFYSYGSTFLMIVKTEGRMLSPHVLLILDAVYCGFFGFWMAIFALHFIYRFLVASGNKRLLASFHSWKFFLWLAGPVFYGVAWSFNVYFLFAPEDYTLKYVSNNVLEVLDLRKEQFIYIGAMCYEEEPNGRVIIHWEPVIGVTVTLLIIVSSLVRALLQQQLAVFQNTSLVTVAVFSVKCYFRIRNLVSKTYSSRSAHLQSQLFNALVTQALIPIFLMHLPGGFFSIFTFFGWDIGKLGETVSMGIALYPVLDPLPTILMVKHYRNGLLEWCLRIGRKTENPRSCSLKSMATAGKV